MCLLTWSSDRKEGELDHYIFFIYQALTSFILGDVNNIYCAPWHFDGEWHYDWFDHALNQVVFVYTIVLVFLVTIIDPSRLVSLGYHQMLGDCTTRSGYYTIIGTYKEKSMYLCPRQYEEEFHLCNIPNNQVFTFSIT